MPAIAITDHGNMFGAIEFYQAALKKGIKPILGFEAYVAPITRFERTKKDDISNYHLILLAKNPIGYKNLVKLSSLANIEGYYYRPRIDWELLEKYHEGLIAMSACLQGEIPSKLLHGRDDEARKTAIRFLDVFGKENFFIELQNHGLADQIKVLPKLIDLGKSLEIPLVATNDSHYVNPEDWEAHDAMLCLQTQSLLKDEGRFKFGSKEFYFKSPQMMGDLFADIPEALTNTLKVAERCNLQLNLSGSILPIFPIPEGKTSESYLEELCRSALPTRFSQVDETVLRRLEFELSVIRKMGFCDYFLIVWDFIRHAREIGVPVGPGRGSAAGSLVAYLLGITNINPLKYGLLFERFLNPDRVSMPDIDIDFSDEGREKIIEHVKEKYGKDKVSQIITFNTILAKLAIRDIGRIMEIPLSEVDKICKLIPEKPNIHLKSVIEEIPELKQMVENGPSHYQRLFRIACTVDGLVRHTGIHAAGIVISRDPITDLVPLWRDKSGELISQYEKNSIEKIGLLKMDFLGLKTLSVIKNSLEFIKLSKGIDLKIDQIPLDDAATFDLLCKGLTLGVFQLESSGMRSLITRLKPSCFEDIIALLAMYRPGPLGSGMVDDFVERKHGRKNIVYPHEELEPILKDTYGVFLYQEQCMKTANVLADFSMGQADQLRKAMAKKIPEDMEKMGKLFVEGAVKRKIPEEKARQIFDLMASFGEYGFNKSHSAAYALITYQTAFLKAHYPVEFMAAVLSSELNDTDKIAEYIDECRAMGIKVLKPDINLSRKLFSVEDGNIRFSLNAIKGVGESAVDSILLSREKSGKFKSLVDFTRRIDTRLVNSRVIEALIKAGAFDQFGLKKSQMLAISAETLKWGQQSQKEKQTGQYTFADLFEEDSEDFGPPEIPVPDIPEMSPRELLMAEKTALGFFLSGNPFQEIAPLGRLFSTHDLKSVLTAGEGNLCRIAGLLREVKKHTTKKGDVMCFITLEADNASLDISIFPAKYSQAAKKLVPEEPLFLVVKTEMVGGALKVNAEEVFCQDDLNQDGFAMLKFNIPESSANRENYVELMKILKKYPGFCPFTLNISVGENQKVVLKLPPGMKVSLTAGLIREWEQICGKGSVLAHFPGIRLENGRNGRFFRGNNGY